MNETELKNMLRNYVVPHENYDCSEIAADFFRASGKGSILRLNADRGFITVWENGEKKSFEYHEVFVLKGKVYDPRFSKEPLQLKDYLSVLSGLTGKKIITSYVIRK